MRRSYKIVIAIIFCLLICLGINTMKYIKNMNNEYIICEYLEL